MTRHLATRKHIGPYRRETPHDDLADLLRPHLESVAHEMAQQIREQVPEYAQPAESEYGRRIQQTISETVEHFVGSLDRPEEGWHSLTELYTRLGAHEARRGNGLEGMQTAMRLSSQVACRRFIKDAYRLGWSRETLALLTDSLFLLLGIVADAAAQGYAAARGELASERERYRGRLRDLLVIDPPTSREAITELARSAGWELPRTVGVVALRRPVRATARLVPPVVLADWDGAAPYLVVPDPDGPGQERLVASLMRDHPGALGPTVPLTRGAVSLRWARRAVALMERDVLPAGTVRCVEQLATLMASTSEDLIEAATTTLLAPILALPAHRRRPLAMTLLVYLQCGDNAVTTGERLHVHQQTVRYRIRRLQELYGGDLGDPDTRLDMMIALNSMLRFTPARRVTGSSR
ncbi:PucR family transcriptional regulator [Actinomadura scrupuli]|uniref:PucR family transcriptional regulator n=1 Tax=Actinomadura scrupuli TaxID=559629 RepID=UPI003D9700A4